MLCFPGSVIVNKACEIDETKNKYTGSILFLITHLKSGEIESRVMYVCRGRQYKTRLGPISSIFYRLWRFILNCCILSQERQVTHAFQHHVRWD